MRFSVSADPLSEIPCSVCVYACVSVRVCSAGSLSDGTFYYRARGCVLRASPGSSQVLRRLLRTANAYIRGLELAVQCYGEYGYAKRRRTMSDEVAEDEEPKRTMPSRGGLKTALKASPMGAVHSK